MMNQPTRILCVDDERNVLRALERIFLDDEYEILTASSGEEGLSLLNMAGQVQVVISDFRMPGMNGVEFLKEVFKSHPETIRIVLSGYADTAAVVAAVNEGKIYKFIPKPWNDDELRVTVAKALETFAIQRRNEQLAEELRQKNEELRELNAHLEQMAKQCSCDFRPQHRTFLHCAGILEHLPLAVIGVDGEGKVQLLNREAALLLGLEGRETLGKTLAELLPTSLADGLCGCGNGVALIEAGGGGLRVQSVNWSEEGEGGLILAMSRAA